MNGFIYLFIYYLISFIGCRPMSLASEKANYDLCAGNKLKSARIMEYGDEFINKFKKNNYFGMVFATQATHDDNNGLSIVKDLYWDFFVKNFYSNVFNNTVIIFMGDHGPRWGYVRSSQFGWFEGRMPAMYIAFPKWFREKYPKHMANLEKNTDRLTTFFDVHSLLKDIVNFQGNEADRKVNLANRGISLFSEIPLRRTCKDADLSEDYCICQSSFKINPDFAIVRQAVTAVIDYINNLLDKMEKGKCVELHLKKIKGASLFLKKGKDTNLINKFTETNNTDNSKSLKEFNELELGVTFSVNPSDAAFEAHVTCTGKVKKICKANEHISRLNLYKQQSHCVQKKLKEFCFCKKAFKFKEGDIRGFPTIQ